MRQKNFGALLLVLFLVAALALTGCQQAGEPAGEADEVAGEAREADVVVIGGGGAGLAAAVSAAENGAEVILLEKMTMLGGNTIRSGGYYNAVDPERQEPLGIEDSIDHHYQQTIEGGDNEGDPALVRILVENALDALHWLEDYGMEFTDKVVAIQGAMWERSHVPAESGGYGYIQTLEKAARDLGVEILLETKAEKLLTDEEGRVVGVKATGADGEELEFRARNGVVLASGGFGANVEMRVKYDPRLTESFPTTNHPGATGDGILMAQELEAGVTGMEHIQLLPLADPKSGSSQHKVVTEIQSTIMVNREGKRFVNEDNRRDVLSAALWNRPMASVCNQRARSSRIQQLWRKGRRPGRTGLCLKADTWRAGGNSRHRPEALVQTVKEFNEAVAKQSDSFGRKVWGNTIEVGPFYATPRCPSIHHTMGGLTINTETQVLKTDGTVIPGLYAAGEVTGGIHGTNRLGGNALADIIVFGRIAGRNAAQGL